MRHVMIALPDELSAALAAPGQDLSRAAFLKSYSVELEYTLEDIERDRETHRHLGLVDACDRS